MYRAVKTGDLMINIGNVKINSLLALAPMAGVTDSAFRFICREMGAGLTYTEMVSAKALCYKDAKSAALLKNFRDEQPFAVQIFGSDPVCMAEGAALAAELSGADIIDINMGCPVGKIVKNGEGSALMKNPELAGRIIESVAKSVSVPVTVKFRKGWDKGNVNAVEFAVIAESAGASAVAVHGRTRAQMYSGTADWNIIRDVKAAVSIPVIANGDIFEPNDVIRILSCTGADMAMIGRGCFGNPWLFSRAEELIKTGKYSALPSVRERILTAQRHIILAAEEKGEYVACLEARRHYSWYIKGIRNAGFYKEQVSKVCKLSELKKITQQLLNDFAFSE